MNNLLQKIKTDNKNLQLLYASFNKRLSRGSIRESSRFECGISSDLMQIIQNEKLKDFTVKIGDEEFKVHKFLLAARSPFLAELIEDNIDAEELNLTDVSTDIFREILNFMYTDKMPKTNDVNFIQLFAAAGLLKMKKLKEFAAEKLMNRVNVENALEILTLANKYECNNLRLKAFEEIKKIFGEIKIRTSFALKPDKLKELLEIKKQKEELEVRFEALLKEH